MHKRSGSVVHRRGKWHARVRYVDPVTNQQRELSKACESKQAARQQKDQWLLELDGAGADALQKSRGTFADFAEWFKRTYLVEATYTPDGQKEHGLRSLRTAEINYRTVTTHFGSRQIREIRHSDLRAFRLQRLQTPTRNRTKRSLATVNREMAMARRMFRVARKEGWITRDPFDEGDSLISLARPRTRTHPDASRGGSPPRRLRTSGQKAHPSARHRCSRHGLPARRVVETRVVGRRPRARHDHHPRLQLENDARTDRRRHTPAPRRVAHPSHEEVAYDRSRIRDVRQRVVLREASAGPARAVRPVWRTFGFTTSATQRRRDSRRRCPSATSGNYSAIANHGLRGATRTPTTRRSLEPSRSFMRSLPTRRRSRHEKDASTTRSQTPPEANTSRSLHQAARHPAENARRRSRPRAAAHLPPPLFAR
jgi:hypothetical protein